MHPLTIHSSTGVWYFMSFNRFLQRSRMPSTNTEWKPSGFSVMNEHCRAFSAQTFFTTFPHFLFCLFSYFPNHSSTAPSPANAICPQSLCAPWPDCHLCCPLPPASPIAFPVTGCLTDTAQHLRPLWASLPSPPPSALLHGLWCFDCLVTDLFTSCVYFLPMR